MFAKTRVGADRGVTAGAGVLRGRHFAMVGFTSTLPLGLDTLRATRRYAQRNIAHCVALTSSRCGCPGGLILGTSDPGGTFERIDPYDRHFQTNGLLGLGGDRDGDAANSNELHEGHRYGCLGLEVYRRCSHICIRRHWRDRYIGTKRR